MKINASAYPYSQKERSISVDFEEDNKTYFGCKISIEAAETLIIQLQESIKIRNDYAEERARLNGKARG